MSDCLSKIVSLIVSSNLEKPWKNIVEEDGFLHTKLNTHDYDGSDAHIWHCWFEKVTKCKIWPIFLKAVMVWVNQKTKIVLWNILHVHSISAMCVFIVMDYFLCNKKFFITCTSPYFCLSCLLLVSYSELNISSKCVPMFKFNYHLFLSLHFFC